MQQFSQSIVTDLQQPLNQNRFALDAPQRLQALCATGLMDTPPEAAFDRFTALVCRLSNVSISLISLVDNERQFFKSAQGLGEPWASRRSTPLSHSFCQHVVTSNAPLMIKDAREDSRLCHNLAIPDLRVIAYLGVPLRTPESYNIGALCAIADKPRQWLPTDLQTLTDLAQLVMTEIAMRHYQQQQQTTEEALYKNQELFQGIINGMHDGVCVRDLDGRYLLVNEPSAALFGFRPQEMIGKCYTELFPADLVEEIREEDRKTLARGKASVREQTWTIGGRPKIFHATRSVYRDAQGNVSGVLGLSHDISALKAVEAALRASEANFRSIFDSMALGVVYHDANGKITNANAAAQAILGLTLAEMQGRTSIDPRWRAARADGSDFPGEEHPAMVALRTGLAQHDIIMYVFNPRQNELRCIRVDAVPQFRSEEERPFQVYALFRDITERRRAEEKLLYHAHLLENMHDAVIATDAQLKITAWNRGAAQMYGWQAGEVMGRPVQEIIRSAISEEQRQSAIRSVRTTGRHHMEVITYHKNDIPIPTESMTMRLKGVDGKIIGYLSINRDISERKAAEEALHRSEEQLRMVIDSVPALISYVDREERFCFVNSTYERWYNMSREQIIGRKMSKVVHPQTYTIMQRYIKAALVGQATSFEVESQRRYPPVTWQMQFTPHIMADGAVNGFYILGFDITDRKQTEKVLQESENRFRAIFEQAAVGMAQCDLAGNYIRVNQSLCKILGYTHNELLQKDSQSITHPDDVVTNQLKMQRLLAGDDDSYIQEKRYLRKDGAYVWVNVTVSLVRNYKTRTPEYFIRVIEDVSQHKQYEQALQELNATLEQRVALRSRQLEISNRNLRESETKLQELNQQLLQRIEEERIRISREIHDQLGQSLTTIKMKVNGAQQSIASEPAAAATTLQAADALLDETVNTVRRIAAELRPSVLDHFGLGSAVEWQMVQFKEHHQIDYDVESNIEPEKISADMATVAFRILQEALTNVVRHAHASVVWVTLTTTEEIFTMTVRDNGRGLKLAPQRRSLGILGMSERARQIGGTVELNGQPGAGVTLTLTAPLHQKAEEKESCYGC